MWWKFSTAISYMLDSVYYYSGIPVAAILRHSLKNISIKNAILLKIDHLTNIMAWCSWQNKFKGYI